jgi:purine/pyrimidine-nucleoside phosphorylase
MTAIPDRFLGVTALTKANVYFNGKVISHSLLFPDSSKKTLGLIFPGQYHFNTDQSEYMEIVAGQCQVKLDGSGATQDYAAGQTFTVPPHSGFNIEVQQGICEYICSFLP